MTDRQITALTYRLQGHTYAYIAKIMGISRQRVYQLLEPPKEVIDLIQGDVCEDCGINLENKKVNIHHVSLECPPDKYQEASNLRLLCVSCHLKAHSRGGEIKIVEKKEKVNREKKRDRKVKFTRITRGNALGRKDEYEKDLANRVEEIKALMTERERT